MPVTYIKGSFRILGSTPDGRSVRFTPIEPAAFVKAGLAVDLKARGAVQIRLEGIDALERNYVPSGGGPRWHQPASLSLDAPASLLGLLGFDQIDRDADGQVVAAIPDATYGYILARSADSFGRATAMVFTGMRTGSGLDGDQVELGIPELLRSVNYQLLAAGVVYPTFFSRLPADLRGVLASAAGAARASRAGVWDRDVTVLGFHLRSHRQLMDEIVLLPRLFRRLGEYLAADPAGGADLAEFSRFLSAKADQVYLPRSATASTLETAVEVQGQHIRLTVAPEHLVFIER